MKVLVFRLEEKHGKRIPVLIKTIEIPRHSVNVYITGPSDLERLFMPVEPQRAPAAPAKKRRKGHRGGRRRWRSGTIFHLVF